MLDLERGFSGHSWSWCINDDRRRSIKWKHERVFTVELQNGAIGFRVVSIR